MICTGDLRINSEADRDQTAVKERSCSSFAASMGLEVPSSRRFITNTSVSVDGFTDIFSSDLGQELVDLPLHDVQQLNKH